MIPIRRRLRSWLNAAAAVLAACLATAPAAAVELQISYANPSLHRPVQEAIAREFMQRHPEVNIVLRPPADSYSAALQRALREAVTDMLPDLGYFGLDTVRALADRGLTVDLDARLRAEPDIATLGYDARNLGLVRYGGRQAAIPFCISLPIAYFNTDLMTKVGADPDHPPQDWDGIIALGGRIAALGGGVSGLWLRYDGDLWYWQALVESFGGRMMDAGETDLAFGGDAGSRAIGVMARAATEAGMADLTYDQARQAFVAGKLGIMMASSSYLADVGRQVANRFGVRTGPFPISSPAAHLPAGGNAVVIFTRDPAKAAAAWEYVKFATGAEAQAIMVRQTGYLPIQPRLFEPGNGLADFLADHPNYAVTVAQLPLTTGWYNFPGPNGLKVNAVIVEQIHRVVVHTATPEQALADMLTLARQALGRP